jgi:hypothetical protein
MNYELAIEQSGAWDLVGDFATEAEAIAAAIANGPGVYGLSGDPGSGHYEQTIEVFEDGTHVAR